MVNGRRVASLVAMTNEAHQAATKRPIAQAYSLSTLVEFEPFVDSTTAVFCSRMDDLYATSHKICDFGQWLQLYAFDVIGELTFSKRLGFLEQGHDVEGIMQSIAQNFYSCSIIGQMPFLDLLWAKNPIYTKFFAAPISSPVIKFGERRLEERLNPDLEPERGTIDIADPELAEKELDRAQPSKPDFLTRFLDLRESHPDVITDSQTLAYLFVCSSECFAQTVKLIQKIDEHQRRQRHNRIHAPSHLLLPPTGPCYVLKTGL